MSDHLRTVALEEHFVSQRFIDLFGFDTGGQQSIDLAGGQLTDLSDGRLRSMDESGIDVQVISDVARTFQSVPPAADLEIARAANDQLAAAVAAHRNRFAAFAALPLTDTQAAVAELERAVNELGFKGFLVNGRTDGRFLDHPSLFPVLERAEQLGVVVYLHPGPPTPALREEHYSGFGPTVSWALGSAAWGWHAETGLAVLRLIAARVFDRLPELKLIVGHLGEMLPFMLERADQWLTPAARRENGLELGVADTVHRNVWMTTSGMFSTAPFQLALQIIGADRLLFSVDYPFSSNTDGRSFLDKLELSPTDRAKLSHGNADQLLGLT